MTSTHSKAEEGASNPNPGCRPVKVQGAPETVQGKVLKGMPQSVQSMFRLTMRHKAIEPIASQLGFNAGEFDHRILAGLAALPRDSATMRWARVNEIAGANKSDSAIGIVALLDGQVVGSEASVIKLCLASGFDQNPFLFLNILRLRQKTFDRTTTTVEDFLAISNSATYLEQSARAESTFVDGCSILLKLSTATDARVLMQSLKALRVLLTGSAGSNKLKERADLAKRIAGARRPVPPLKGHELVSLFKVLVPSSGYYKNENASGCVLKDEFPKAQLYQLSYEEIRVVLNQNVDPSSDPHKLLASSIVKIYSSSKMWIGEKAPSLKDLKKSISGIHRAVGKEQLAEAFSNLSELCNGLYTTGTAMNDYIDRIDSLSRYNSMEKAALEDTMKKVLGQPMNTKQDYFTLLHMCVFEPAATAATSKATPSGEDKRYGKRPQEKDYAKRRMQFVDAAKTLFGTSIGGDDPSLEALFDLNICVQGRYLSSDLKLLKTASRNLCVQLDM